MAPTVPLYSVQPRQAKSLDTKRLYPESGDLWINVQMKISDKCCSSGGRTATGFFNIFTTDVESGIESARLWMTPNGVVWSTHPRDETPSRDHDWLKQGEPHEDQ